MEVLCNELPREFWTAFADNFFRHLRWYFNPERFTVYVWVRHTIHSNPRALRVFVWAFKILPFSLNSTFSQAPKNRKTLGNKRVGKCHIFSLSTDNQHNKWRRERDSNPRYSYLHTRFPSVLFKPLRHLSKLQDRSLWRLGTNRIPCNWKLYLFGKFENLSFREFILPWIL